MTQEERTQLIREIKELLIFNNDDNIGLFDSETKNLLLSLLDKMLVVFNIKIMEHLDSTIMLKVYKEIKKFSNEELRFLVKDIVTDNKKMSPNALKLFAFYSDYEPGIGVDRFVQIRKFLEHEIIDRIEKNIF